MRGLLKVFVFISICKSFCIKGVISVAFVFHNSYLYFEIYVCYSSLKINTMSLKMQVDYLYDFFLT